MKKRILSAFLSVVMVLTLLPTVALAGGRVAMFQLTHDYENAGDTVCQAAEREICLPGTHVISVLQNFNVEFEGDDGNYEVNEPFKNFIAKCPDWSIAWSVQIGSGEKKTTTGQITSITVDCPPLAEGQTSYTVYISASLTGTYATNEKKYEVWGYQNLTIKDPIYAMPESEIRTVDLKDITDNKLTLTPPENIIKYSSANYKGETVTLTREGFTVTATSSDCAVVTAEDGTLFIPDPTQGRYRVSYEIKDKNGNFIAWDNQTVNVTNGDVPAKEKPTVSANALTVTYDGNPVPASKITGTAVFDGNPVSGTWSWKDATAVTAVADSGDKTVVFTPNDATTYDTVETTLTLTINKATPTGEPKYTAITESGKTLSDAGLTAEGGTLSPSGTVQWVDANGTALAGTTAVAANTAYRWLFTPADTANYNTLSGSVTLYRVSSGGGGGSSTSTTTPVEPTTSTSNGTTTAVVTVKPSTSGTSSTASVTTSTVQAAVDAAAKSDASSAAVEIQVSTPANATEVKVSLPTAALETVADGKTESLTIQSGVGSVTLSSEALASVAKQAESAVEITVSEVDTAKTLNERQQAAAGDAPVYDLSIKSGSSYISEFDGGLITVSLPYTLKAGEDPSGVVVWYLDENGNIEKVRTMYDVKTQTVIFTTNHFSLYVVGYDPTALWTNPFTDVSESDYYCDAVRWAAAKGVTGGTSATTFAPNTTCTRAQTVTFLWRAAGSPEPTATANPFTDVSEDAYYYKAVLWAVGEGITAGTSATTFAPDATVSRAQVAVFLWRAAGKSTVDYAMAFTDVSADSYYTEAVRWAVSEGITSGTSETTFAPADACTRAQIVTLLYRYLDK